MSVKIYWSGKEYRDARDYHPDMLELEPDVTRCALGICCNNLCFIEIGDADIPTKYSVVAVVRGYEGDDPILMCEDCLDWITHAVTTED